jgi:hypothetical protein
MLVGEKVRIKITERFSQGGVFYEYKVTILNTFVNT